MAIRCAKIASVTDSTEPSVIQPSDLNPESVPSSPADGDFRTERTGTSPFRFIRGYVFDSGEWQLVFERQI
jgi:hypothetical protein